MNIRVTPKTKGNVVNVRQAMSGKGNSVVVGTLPDGFETVAAETTNDSWLKVETDDIKGYIRSDLVTVLIPETQVELPEDTETDPENKDETEDTEDVETNSDEE